MLPLPVQARDLGQVSLSSEHDIFIGNVNVNSL